MAVTFVLLMVLAQAALAVTARNAATAAVAAAARQAAVATADPDAVEARLLAALRATVPGAGPDIHTSVVPGAVTVTAAASFRWSPPGPVLVPIDFSVEATYPRDVPP